MIKKVILAILALFVLSIIVYFMGPRVAFDPVDATPIYLDYPLTHLDSIIDSQEALIKDLKPDNEARIVWADDSLKQKTDYALVYLHGFSSSQEEGDPIHEAFAQRYGCNLYLSRLYDHGRFSDHSFENITPQDLIHSAKEAIAIGRLLGEKVILMSCSTGGTFSAYLATQDTSIHSMIMYSPNIDVYDPKSDLLLAPWGKQLMAQMTENEQVKQDYQPEQAKYWNETYHTDGLFSLMSIIDQTMNEQTFNQIDVPVFMGYYYEDEAHQDMVVSVERMHDFFSQIATSEDQKRAIAFPKAGRHVISADILSADWQGVQAETFRFAEEILDLKPRSTD